MQGAITAFVVGFNEGELLKKSLAALTHIDELIYVDLGSSDNSIAIAQKYSAKIIQHERVPVVEIIHAKLLRECKNEWILITDPDEVVSSDLQIQLNDLTKTDLSDVAMITAPCLFYFKDHPLKGTIWGGNNSRVVLLNKNKINFSGSVHRGRTILSGFKCLNLPNTGTNIVHHYWMSSYEQLFEKHKRYVEQEGKSMYEAGIRSDTMSFFKIPFSSFKECFFTKKGYMDGFIGLTLALFWSWYKVNAYKSLVDYENIVKK